MFGDAAVTAAIVTAAGAVCIAMIGAVSAIYSTRRTAKVADREALLMAQTTEATEKASLVEVAQKVLVETIQYQRSQVETLRTEATDLQERHQRCIRKAEKLERQLFELLEGR